MQETAESIRQYGVLQPLTVRKAGGAYVPVSGAVRIYDSYAKELEFVGGKRVLINDIYSIKILADRDDTDEQA